MIKRLLLSVFLLGSCLSFGQNEDTSNENVGFAIIENVPVYPGCTGSDNIALKHCMSEKISAHVMQNFNKSLAEALDLPAGKQRIFVQFTINKTGNVVNIRARAPHSILELEAVRVMELLPQMKPGMQKGETVNVLYSLPIVFEVEESKKEKRERLKRERASKGN
ncbi:energy transducer TonB [Altibacter lentus]|uniref:energy transducer TonB n=1 Tax=Altibacter lentus TaxID=1223410 RepID=UPI00068A5C26|nr:energy transducer TonB [Altibacter lentus]